MSKVDDLRKDINTLYIMYLDAQNKVKFLTSQLEIKREEFKQLDFDNALTDGRVTICKPSIRKETKQVKKKKPLTISGVEQLAAKLGLSHILEGLTRKEGHDLPLD